jgi:hypothetical protein
MLSSEDASPCEDNLGSDHDDSGMVVGIDSIPTLHVRGGRVRKNLVAMNCVGKDCLVLLDSGAVRSVGSSEYLSRFCPQWKSVFLPVSMGNFHSASGKLTPLGAVKVLLTFHSIKLVVQFVVVADLTAPYFIIGNDYLVKHCISLLNGPIRQFSIGGDKFEFNEGINSVREMRETRSTEDPFVSQVKQEAKISDSLGLV